MTQEGNMGGERTLQDELVDIVRSVVCCAEEGPASARELGLMRNSPLVIAAKQALARLVAETLSGSSELASHAAALQAKDEEIERLKAVLLEEQAVCLCGCPVENHDESQDGLCCEDGMHECALVSVAARSIVLAMVEAARAEGLREGFMGRAGMVKGMTGWVFNCRSRADEEEMFAAFLRFLASRATPTQGQEEP